MTKPFVHFLAFEDGRWHGARDVGGKIELAEATAFPDARKDSSAADGGLGQWLDSLGSAGRTVCLGLPSEMVLAAAIDCANLPKKNRTAAMLYRLEEQLPVEAERLTVDFLPVAVRDPCPPRPPEGDGKAAAKAPAPQATHGESALGLAVETSRAKAMIEQLDAAGVHVGAICPTAMLAMWEACQAGQVESGFVVVAASNRLEVFRLAAGKPVSWDTVPPAADELVCCINAELLIYPATGPAVEVGVAGKIDAAILSAVEARTGARIVHLADDPQLDLAARAARKAAGGQAGWVDFSHGDLAPANAWQRFAAPAYAATVLAAVILVMLTGMFVWRGRQAAKMADRNLSQQAEEYAHLFPGSAVPPNIKSRLGSEVAKLSAMYDSAAGMPVMSSALDGLRRIFAGLPPAVQLQIADIRVGPEDVLIEGQASSHADVETVSRALNNAGLAMGPPRTAGRSGGVSFTLSGKLNSEKPAIPATGARP